MKVGIIGLGLIGGSLGLDLRNCGHIIYGVSRKESTCNRALEKEVVDYADINLKSLSTVDIIFICTPIGLISQTLKQLILAKNIIRYRINLTLPDTIYYRIIIRYRIT